MNVLDSPLDALAVNYLSFGFLTVVNNLWTWVAVITAAVSFWKIRGSGLSLLSPAEPCDDRRSKGSESISDQVLSSESTAADKVVEQRKPVPEQAAPVQFSVGGGDFDEYRVTKGRLTLHYYEENTAASCSETVMEEEMEEQLQQSTEGDCGFMYGCESSEWWESWGRMLRLRMADNGWYSHQDLTVFNGNVVRLWDACCTGTSNLIRDNSSFVVC